MNSPDILLVDDEPSLITVLEPVLRAAGYRVRTATDARSALALAEAEAPDLVLLDLGLPDLDGKDVIGRMRRQTDAPIIVISARHQGSEKIAALDEGADDYIDKPFEIGVLMARIRVALRRRAPDRAEPKIFRAGPLCIDFRARLVSLDDQPLKLSPKEYELLKTLAFSAGHIVTHKRLLTLIWGAEARDTQYLRVYVGQLRQKIEQDPAEPRLILTVPGVGYRLVPSTL